jgi:hypothetical protein
VGYGSRFELARQCLGAVKIARLQTSLVRSALNGSLHPQGALAGLNLVGFPELAFCAVAAIDVEQGSL